MAQALDNPTRPGSSTGEQRAYMMRLAHQRGMNVDDVRDMTPEHCVRSLRNLSKIEASVLIDALKEGKQPDYSRRPKWSRKPKTARPPRLPQGVVRMPTIEQLNMDMQLVEWLAAAWKTTVGGVEQWLAKRHYKSHGGPMHVIRTAGDCVERIELMKAVRFRTENAARIRHAM